MPVCLNDPEKKYAGTEPSPKGLGYCAHAQAIGSTRDGLDGEKWQVRKDKNGTKSWKKVSTVKGGKPKAPKAPKAAKAVKKIKDAVLKGVEADQVTDDALKVVDKAVKAQEKANKAVVEVVQDAVAVGGPEAGMAVLDTIKQIQARLQTAKRSQINMYLRAKKKQGLFTKPVITKGYGIQDARADAIALRENFVPRH